MVKVELNILLSKSTICRLCGEENENGINLFNPEDPSEDLASVINKYLPITVEKDEKVPSMLCPGCTIQLEATKSFFDLIIEGQTKIRNLILSQHKALKLQIEEKEKLENALKLVNSSTSVQSYELGNEESGENFFYQIFPEESIFTADQETFLKNDEVEKPKKKRGRPHKSPPKEEDELIKEKVPKEEPKSDLEGKRRIKKPSRYIELLEGKEFEDLFRKEGISDDENFVPGVENKGEETKTKGKYENVIGMVEGENGENLGQLITVKNKCKLIKKHSIYVKETIDKQVYKCDICGLEFKHNNQLSMHLEFHKSFFYRCKSCSENFETKIALDEHQKIANHFGYKFEEVLVNNNEVDNLENTLENELETPLMIEPKTKQILESKPGTENQISNSSCKKCNIEFNDLPSLEEHNISTHKNKTYQCEECPRVFYHPSSLIYHRDADHNGGKKYICLKCKKPFKHKQLLLKHQHVHSDERPHICTQCSATFKTRANLLKHMLIHSGEKNFVCTECGQRFSHKTSLSLHMRMHNGDKPFKCDVCSKSFSQKGNLAEHKRIHTGEKPYVCSYCGRKFTTSSQCFLHIKRHTGEKPWKCEYCYKTFLHKETWACHTRRHRNETPFQCKQCLRSFSDQWSLRKHQRLHTGEKPYKCDVCQKCFADCSNLRKHKKIHRDIAPLIKVEVEKGSSSDKELPQQVSLQLYYNADEGKEDTLVQIVNSEDDQQILLDDAQIHSSNDEISSELQIQHLIDNDGNSVVFTTDDGEKIKVVSTIIDNEPTLQGLMNDGTLIPLNLSTDGKSIIFGNDHEENNSTSKATAPLKLSTCNKVEVLSSTLYKSKNKQAIFDANKLEYVNMDPENVCLVMPFDDDEGKSQNEFIY